MQYPPRRTPPLVVFFMFLVGCAVEEAPEPCGVESEDFGLDVQLGGLDDDATYWFQVVADGGYAMLGRTPGAESSFVETPLAGDRTLITALFGDVLRLAILAPDGASTGPAELTVRVHSRGELLVEERFEPTYAEVAPTGPDCDGFQVQVERLVVPAH